MESMPQTLLITYVVPTDAPKSAFDPDVDFDSGPTVEDLKQASGPDKIDLLAALMQKMDKAELTTLLQAFTKPEKKTHKGTPHAGPTTQYKIITVHHFCRNCGMTYVYTTQLSEGQNKTYIRKNNSVGNIVVKKNFEPMTVQSWSNQCEMCRTRMSQWPREKLEERYMQLLCILTVGHDPSTNDW